MKIIDQTNWPRKSQYELFKQLPAPHFSLTSSVKVTSLVALKKKRSISLFNAMLYHIMTAVNAVPELRMRFRENSVVEHEVVHASATIPIENDRFAFCGIKYVPDWNIFDQECKIALEIAKKQLNLEEHIVDNDEWIFLSCLPWTSFTAMTNPHGGQTDCIPRVTWGRVIGHDSDWVVPVSIQVHHALVDGIHVGKFYNHLSENIAVWENPQ